MEGDGDRHLPYSLRNTKVQTQSRMNKKQWWTRTEDALYFRHNVPSHLLGELVADAFRKWGQDYDPVETAKRAIDRYVRRCRRHAVDQDQRWVQEEGEEAGRVCSEHQTVRETTSKGHAQEEGCQDREQETV